MINVKFDVRRLKRKLESVENAVIEVVGEAMQEGYLALLDQTPEDTGFLRASWYQTVGAGGDHPNPPDYAFKKTLRWPAGRQPEFVDNYMAALADAASQSYNVGMQVGSRKNIAISKVVWRNTAPYAKMLDERPPGPDNTRDNRGWIYRATQAANAAIKEYLHSANLKAHMR